jgi:hypothetical protein
VACGLESRPANPRLGSLPVFIREQDQQGGGRANGRDRYGEMDNNIRWRRGYDFILPGNSMTRFFVLQ